ncbi:MAG: bifunctional diaminohydroxyphosphoribosylaminopyrimidine deaminase/5-amino-6-(5-phosphoribosylamino)uracil reductase RibD [Myxococcales bacterium]|nr:MAG: bifunctional diaminohydroxyphosphoribosylaminopyrimidine deaminase/5-amino-6-(5-phosphoribosylamino)uracil reductase RibD [Myxococcales bacterium]
MSASFDEEMMQLALREAKRGFTSPNPHVGAVLVKDGKVLSTGFHKQVGLAHAEVAALEGSLEAAKGATLYVTLEPCNHHGRTQPCTDAIIEASIARIVIGCLDPANRLPSGYERLKQAGLEVELGVCQSEAEELVADFKKHYTTGIPLVTLKAALSLDGRIATANGQSKWITGEAARKLARDKRAETGCVIVGVQTVLADDPELNVRDSDAPQPLRAVLDPTLKTPPQAKILSSSPKPCLIFHGPKASIENERALLEAGAELFQIAEDEEGGLKLAEVLEELGRRDYMHVLIEGGSRVHSAFMKQKLIDRVMLFIAPILFADKNAMPLLDVQDTRTMDDVLRLKHSRVTQIGEDILLEGAL